jgi:hypothetical protein
MAPARNHSEHLLLLIVYHARLPQHRDNFRSGVDVSQRKPHAKHVAGTTTLPEVETASLAIVDSPQLTG